MPILALPARVGCSRQDFGQNVHHVRCSIETNNLRKHSLVVEPARHEDRLAIREHRWFMSRRRQNHVEHGSARRSEHGRYHEIDGGIVPCTWSSIVIGLPGLTAVPTVYRRRITLFTSAIATLVIDSPAMIPDATGTT